MTLKTNIGVVSVFYFCYISHESALLLIAARFTAIMRMFYGLFVCQMFVYVFMSTIMGMIFFQLDLSRNGLQSRSVSIIVIKLVYIIITDERTV